MEWKCWTCSANWTAGKWTEGCEECGGGAMTRPCLVCGGKCGFTWQRAPMDSNDFSQAHWTGGCPDWKKHMSSGGS